MNKKKKGILEFLKFDEITDWIRLTWFLKNNLKEAQLGR